MRGHERIIELRKQGIKPKIIFINDWPCDVNWFDSDDQATVSTFKDSITSLDLRFLTGCMVSISATDESRAKALFKRAIEAGARSVAACHVKQNKKTWEQDGWTEVFHAS